MYKNDYSLPRGTSRRTWLAAGAALAAVLVLLGLIAVACNNRSERDASAAGAATPASPSGTPGSGGTDAAASGGLGSGGSGADGGGNEGGNGGNEGASGGGGGGNGSNGDNGGDSGDEPGSAQPSPKDCVSYDPANLTVEPSGDAWRLRDGNHAMKLFDTQTDAEDGLKVARNWTSFCFIGRGNDEPDRYRFIIHYWEQPSGLPFGPAPSSFDCFSYNPENLEVSLALTGDAWVVRDGGLVIVALASEADAERARLVASGFSQKCVIGGDNTRDDHYRYTMDYWRP
jgi:hypothetical protein